MRRRFIRRVAGFVLLMLIVVVGGIVGLAWLISSLVGPDVSGALLPAVLLLMVLVLGFGAASRVGRAAAPIADLVEASGRIEAGETGTRVPERGPREVRQLARAFNAMSARLADDDDRRRRLLADVSHELRTPLTVIAGNVEGMLDGLYPTDRAHLERLLAETRHMERLVEDLRTLALADAGALPLHREPTDLGMLARDVVHGFAPQADEAGVTLSVDADESVPELPLDPHRLRQVIGNLVANALRHTTAGGTVRVRVAFDGDTVILEASDDGSGMDPDAAGQAFERFWRAGDAAGAGLGLAIVRNLVEAHGGSVGLESAPGRGTKVHARFPADDV